MEIEWDDSKDAANQKKHGGSFAEASQLLLSKRPYLELFDEAHSDVEERFIAIGPIRRGLVLIVWTERDEDIVRIISARWATERERALYRAPMEGQR